MLNDVEPGSRRASAVAASVEAPQRTCAPRTLLSPQRLDLVVKHDLFRTLIDGGGAPAEDRYRRHILCRTGGFEGSKRSVDDYLDAAAALLESLQQRGFQPSVPVPLGALNGLPLDGAHRIAASLALGIDIEVADLPGVAGGAWDLEWFRQHGFGREDLEHLLRRYAVLAARPAVFIFWGPSRAKWHELADALAARLPIVGALDVDVAADEVPLVVDDVYAWRLGPRPNDRIRAKGERLRQGEPAFRVVLVDLSRTAGDETALLTTTKRALRAIAGRDENDFATTVHASDCPDEARYLTELFFNRNYLRLLADRARAPLRTTFEQWLERYAAALEARGIAREDACVVGSAVLEAIGLRTSTDIDCVVGRREPRFHAGVVSLAEGVDLVTQNYHRRADDGRTFPDDRIVSDPALHFHVRGMKFANPEIVIDRKRQHGRPKDLADVALWDRRAASAHRADRPLYGCVVSWCEQEPDVQQFEALQRAADLAGRAGSELVVAGLGGIPVGASFPCILRPSDLSSYPASPVPTSSDALSVLTGIGIDVPALLDEVSVVLGPPAHPGMTRQRLAACSWIARWMKTWLIELNPRAVHVPNQSSVMAKLFTAVVRHLAIPATETFEDLDGEAAAVVASRTVCRHANEALALQQPVTMCHDDSALAEAAASAQRERLERALDETQRRLEQREDRVRLLEWTLTSHHLSLWIWGAGAAGTGLRHWLADRRAVVAGIVDGNVAKAGTLVDGIAISTPDALLRVNPRDLRVIVASLYADEILVALERLGVPRQDVLVWQASSQAGPSNPATLRLSPSASIAR